MQSKQCKLYNKSIKNLDKVTAKKLIEFLKFKPNNPQEKFGSSDYAFGNKGNLGGYFHAHLTFDNSVVYKIENNILYLYGVFSHDELGTGQPANINKQKSMKQKLDNQEFV